VRRAGRCDLLILGLLDPVGPHAPVRQVGAGNEGDGPADPEGHDQVVDRLHLRIDPAPAVPLEANVLIRRRRQREGERQRRHARREQRDEEHPIT
jgi:hypothetical protein